MIRVGSTRIVDWYEDRSNLAALWRWMEQHDEPLPGPAGFMEKPWRFTREWNLMQEEVQRDAA